MIQHLLFTVYAPLGAWGSASSSAAGQARKLTDLEPSRSALVGLLAAALGWRRERIGEIDQAVSLAVRIDVAPERESHPDYHTVTPGMPPAGALRWTRFAELRGHLAGGATGGSILSQREFWSNGLWTVAGVATSALEPTLDRLHAALTLPRWPLFAGRKAFTLGLPPDPALIEARDLATAFAAYGPPWQRRPSLRPVLRLLAETHGRNNRDRLLFDPGMPGSPESVRSAPRRDRPDPAIMDDGVAGPWVRPRWHERTRGEAWLPREVAAL